MPAPIASIGTPPIPVHPPLVKPTPSNVKCSSSKE